MPGSAMKVTENEDPKAAAPGSAMKSTESETLSPLPFVPQRPPQGSLIFFAPIPYCVVEPAERSMLRRHSRLTVITTHPYDNQIPNRHGSLR